MFDINIELLRKQVKEMTNRETFDKLYRRHHAKENIMITRNNYYYSKDQYKY